MTINDKNAQARLSEVLETLVDSNELTTVLETLEDICHGKAEHLLINLQDEVTARVWERAARRIGMTASGIKSLVG